MYCRTRSWSSPTVLTQYPRAQKLRRNNCPFVCNSSRWIRVALLPFRYPIVIAMLYRGGTLSNMWMWSGIAFDALPQPRFRPVFRQFSEVLAELLTLHQLDILLAAQVPQDL